MKFKKTKDNKQRFRVLGIDNEYLGDWSYDETEVNDELIDMIDSKLTQSKYWTPKKETITSSDGNELEFKIIENRHQNELLIDNKRFADEDGFMFKELKSFLPIESIRRLFFEMYEYNYGITLSCYEEDRLLLEKEFDEIMK